MFSALQLIVFYKWVKLLLHRIDKKVYWEEIKTVLSDLIKRKLKGDFASALAMCLLFFLDASPTIITTADPNPLILEDFSTALVPGLLLEPADITPVSHPEFILNDRIPPARSTTSLKPILVDAVEFNTLQPETTTTTIIDIIPNLLHESSEEAAEEVSLHEHEIIEDDDELDQTTESGATYNCQALSSHCTYFT